MDDQINDTQTNTQQNDLEMSTQQLVQDGVIELTKKGIEAETCMEIMLELSQIAFMRVNSEMMMSFTPEDLEAMESMSDKEMDEYTKKLYEENAGVTPEIREMQILQILINELIAETNEEDIKDKLEKMADEG